MQGLKPWRAAALVVGVLCAPGCVVQTPGSPSPASRPQGGLREKVETLLSGYERLPTPEDWKALGPGALEVLEQIYADPSTLPSTRTRAVASMALVDNPGAVSRLEAIVADPAADAQYRSTAVLALAFRTGETALPQLETSLSDRSPAVREAAANALGRLAGPAARRAIEARLAAEQDPTVRDALERSLKKTQP